MADYFSALQEVRDERKRWAARDSTSPIEGDNMDLLRLLEYPQLLGKTYLDHAGTTPWAKSLTNAFAQVMTEDLYGNPHSMSAPSRLSDARVELAREKALTFFNADPEHFDLVFVANATAAIKLVHDCFRDHGVETARNWWYGYHKDAHTSLVGVREGTRTHRCFRSDREVNLWIEGRGLGGAAAHDVGLFAYPGQSNMTGRRLPLDWPARIRKRVKGEVYTLLDAAALASTTQLDLSDPDTAPDFVALSFYKIFGFPNLGALIVRKSASKVLTNRKFFGGGTVEMVIAVNEAWVSRKKTSIHSRLEDGTLPFTSIFALDVAIDVHRKLYGPSPMKYISMHTCRLIKKLYDQLVVLRHSNGVPVIRVYNEKAAVYGEAHLQGATIAFNIQKPVGGLVNFLQVEEEADRQSIYVRSGSLCNPGGVATHLQWSPKELLDAYAEGHRCSEPLAELFGKPLGVVRVSLGAMSNDHDIDVLVDFIKTTYVDRVFPSGGPMVLPDLLQPPGTASTANTSVARTAHSNSHHPQQQQKPISAFAIQVSATEEISSSSPPRTRTRSRTQHWNAKKNNPPNNKNTTTTTTDPLTPPSSTPSNRGPQWDDGTSVANVKSLSSRSTASRIRDVRRSIMGVLHLH